MPPMTGPDSSCQPPKRAIRQRPSNIGTRAVPLSRMTPAVTVLLTRLPTTCPAAIRLASVRRPEISATRYYGAISVFHHRHVADWHFVSTTNLLGSSLHPACRSISLLRNHADRFRPLYLFCDGHWKHKFRTANCVGVWRYPAACNDNYAGFNPEVSVQMQAGVRYIIAIGGALGARGAFTLSGAPSNVLQVSSRSLGIPSVFPAPNFAMWFQVTNTAADKLYISSIDAYVRSGAGVNATTPSHLPIRLLPSSEAPSPTHSPPPPHVNLQAHSSSS